MTTEKRGHAINGDLFALRHPTMALDRPFTTFIDVTFRGTTHQAFVALDRSAFSYAHVTGEFSVAGYHGYLLENIDTVETRATHRYQALVDTAVGVLSIHSYESTDHLLALVGALRPGETALGVVIEPDDEVEFASPPRVALDVDVGLVEITPLTGEVIDRLPTWQGTPVGGGHLYGGHFADDRVHLTLVTPTCRVMALPGPGVDADAATDALSELEARWSR